MKNLLALRCAMALTLAVWILTVGMAPALAAAEPEPSLPPRPQITPLVPGVTDEQSRDPEDRLINRLNQAVQTRDDRIQALLDRASGDLPPTGGEVIPEAEPDRAERDRAWRDLEQALGELAEQRQRPQDILDTPAALSDDFQVQSLRAHNRLAIARSYKALLEDADQPAVGELHKAFEITREISTEHLGEHARPQRLYLIFWFASELAIRSQGQEQTAYVEAARNAHLRLTTDWPSSVSLVISANTLLEQLNSQLQSDTKL